LRVPVNAIGPARSSLRRDAGDHHPVLLVAEERTQLELAQSSSATPTQQPCERIARKAPAAASRCMSYVPHNGHFMTREAGPVRAGSWVRVTRRTRGFTAFGLLCSMVFALIPVIVLLSSSKQSSVSSVGGFIGVEIFCLCVAVPGLLFTRRLSRAGLWMAADGIVVRNPLRTITVSVSDADEFVAGLAAGAGNGTPCPILKRRHGRPVAIWALGREGFVWSFRRYGGEMKPLCDELNHVLSTLRPVPQA
jgi:hypothetical protein